MKKPKLDKKYIKISLYVLFVICASIAFRQVIENVYIITTELNILINTVKKILSPFIYGLFIAYLLNTSVRWIENSIYGRIAALSKRPAMKRNIAAITTYILFLGIIIWIIGYLIPEIVQSAKNLVLNSQASLSRLYNSGNEYDYDVVNNFLESINTAFSTDYSIQKIVDMAISPVMTRLSRLPNIVNSLLTGTFNMAAKMINVILGLIISFYMVCDKERFANVATKFLFTIFKKSTAEKIIFISKDSNRVFEKFFISKAIDSSIIGVIFFVCTILFKLPYAALLSIIIGITNMIPYFGPFIGAVPVVLIVLLNNPSQAVFTAILIFIIQQFDGYILGPKILGDSIGLRPIAVIFSITVGGALAGVLGMFFGVPIFAVLKNLTSSIINRRYDQKYYTNEEGIREEHNGISADNSE